MRFNSFIANAMGLATCTVVGAGCAGTIYGGYGGAGFVEAPHVEDGHYGPGPFHDTSYYEDLYGAHGVYDDVVVSDRRDVLGDRVDRRDQAVPVHDHGRD